MDAAGFVQMIQIARTDPSRSPSKISSADRPGAAAIVPGPTPQ